MDSGEAQTTQMLISLTDKLMGEFRFHEDKRIELIKNLGETISFYLWLKEHGIPFKGRHLHLPTVRKKLKRLVKCAKEFSTCLKDINTEDHDVTDFSNEDIQKAVSDNVANTFVKITIETAYNQNEDFDKEKTESTSCLEAVQIKLNHTTVFIEDMLERLKGKGAGPTRRHPILEEIIQRLIYAYKIVSGEENPRAPQYNDANDGYEGDLYFFIIDCINVIIEGFVEAPFELGSIIGKVLVSPDVLISGDKNLISAQFHGFRLFSLNNVKASPKE